MSSNQSNGATVVGYSGLLMWSCYALLVTAMKGVPTFEMLTIIFLCGFIAIATRLTIRGEWYKIKQPVIVWVVGVVGILGNDFTTIAAFKAAPPVQVELINYLWPMMVVLFASFLPGERFTTKHFLSAFIGLYGAYILMTHDHGLAGFHWNYLTGYILAFAGGVIWALYCLISRFYSKTPLDMLGMYFGIGALVSFMCHWRYEATVMPSLGQFVVLAIMALTTSGLAYFCWDFGCKNGNVKLLSILTYGNPILSAILLIIFTTAHYSNYLAIAAALVVLASVISTVYWSGIWHKTMGKLFVQQPKTSKVLD